MTVRLNEITSACQLLVEGNDARNFMEAFAEHLGISAGLQIQNFGGVDELRGFLSAFAKMPRFSDVGAIGVVRDAEMNAEGAFGSVQSSLQNANLPVPNAVGMHSGGSPDVTVLILPGGGRPGMLETLLCETFKGTAVDRCIDDFFQCLPETVPDNRLSKARVRAWIAAQEQPYVSVGVAAKKGFMNLDHDALKPIREFLKSLPNAA